jgi:predicted membrane chloride channel (bestrophin family)
MTVFSGAVTWLDMYLEAKYGFLLQVPPTLIQILSITVGLLLVFRTNTAYERYWEGRKLWSSLQGSVRSLSRQIWVGVPDSDADVVKEKKAALDLLVAFAVATKHYLRTEVGLHYPDLARLVPSLPPQLARSSTVLSHIAVPCSSSSSLSSGEEETAPLLHKSELASWSVHHNLPLEISYLISSFISRQCALKRIDSQESAQLKNTLANLVSVLTDLERINSSPIPAAYRIHLRHTLVLYCMALPFQLLQSMNWNILPVMLIASFTLFGIESIGSEIENPFGYDPNDLPVDHFCEQLQLELKLLMEKNAKDYQTWYMNEQPVL